MRRSLLLFLLLGLMLTALPVAAVEVDLDPTFSGNGKVIVTPRTSGATAVQEDNGSVYAAGMSYVNDRPRVFVSRLDEDGTVDRSFGDDGHTVFRLNTRHAFAATLSISDDGSLTVGVSCQGVVIVARLDPMGVLDTTFSGDGIRYLPGEASGFFYPPRGFVDGAGRVVLGAMVEAGSGGDVKVWRLLPSGALDPAWSRDGVRTIDTGSDVTDWLDTMTLDNQDRVLIGTDEGVGSPARVYRFRTDGSLDPGFSGDGITSFRLARRASTFPIGIDVANSGLITVAASGYGNHLFGAARLTSAGELDPGYSDRGILTLSCRENCQPVWGDAENGRVAIALDYLKGPGDRLRVARISANGTGVRLVSVDPFHNTTSETVDAIEIDGQRTLIAGASKHRAYVARLA